jgi:1-acyl-sn-glycerol-3-phosphate acyltransferase
MQKKLPGKFSMLIRSTIFSIVVPVFTVFYSMLCVASYVMPLRYRFHVVMGWSRTIVWLLKVICCIDYKITGRENIPKDRNGIVMSKHQSAWETFYLPPRFHQTAIILKRELYWVPFFGWGMAASNPIGINRNDKLSAMNQIITKGKQCLEEGRWVLVFPEGTRIAPGEVGKYRLGGARLASDSGYPVLPVAHDAGYYWSRRKFIKTPGTIEVVYGPIIETKGRTAEEILALTKDWIEGTMVKLAAKHQKPQK